MSIPVFVGTKETQGQRDNDFSNVSEGEIVIFPVVPDWDNPMPSMRGIESTGEQTSTTTMRVSLFNGSIEALDKKILTFLRDEGWVRPKYIQARDRNFASRLSEEAAKFPVGTVVEYRNGAFKSRH